VEALGLLAGSEPIKIVVRFVQAPDLVLFFHLRHSLASLLQREVDLLPDFALSASYKQGQVEWIW